jgi:hypothetical protein
VFRALTVTTAKIFALTVVAGVLIAAVPARKIPPSVKKASAQSSQRANQPLPESARIQVAWSMVRSRVTSFGATSRNENYREIWHLWRKADGALVLISPRAKVAVQQATPDQSIVTNEGDLATLLGLLPRPVPGGKSQGNLVASAMGRSLSIDLREPRVPVQTQFNFGDEESYAVTFEIQSLKPE